MASDAIPVPPQFKPIQHHLRTAQEHEKRDPVVAYFCRLYAMQSGMKIDSKTPECRKFLVKLMDQLEIMKSQLGDNESITQDVVGNAHVENYAYKMFLYADTEDRAGRFHKNMIKSFYTASLLYDVLTVFGELTEENIQHRKYAKWKAAYIHNCLKNGETPQSGPTGMDDDEILDNESKGDGSLPQSSISNIPPDSMPTSDLSNIQVPPGDQPPSNFSTIHIPPGAHAPANTPAEVPGNSVLPNTPTIQPVPQTIPIIDPSLYNVKPQGEVRLTPEDYARAQKYCKYAGSALQYEDVGTAVQNLQKALQLLTTGRE
ncbi:vacuolar protein sorting-associated protein VTA1 homolog isoform X1 [Scyliorhinus canicula]|uniref:vacuolar protein sorting-associated protein VTA1 homolog isoform X1 n=1 Tax=Scyliorhinus canicula TaxID=7830 RepID=UPI0018F3F249|nr:vacuolar protein sorting-associated protein VTA1 homolog isoform X1 [Scyliorhinus canicula]